jgi:steroid 5-alpha reductase family enzyme
MSENNIFNLLLVTVFLLSFFVFAGLFFISAPYGKFYRKGWGMTLKSKTGWMLMELPSFAIMIFLFFVGNKKTSPVSLIFLIIWSIHYFHRSIIYPCRMSDTNKKFPFLILIFALVFNFINSYLNGRYLFYFSNTYPISWLRGARFITGLIIFVIGMSINIQSDSFLLNLRKSGNKDYKIPDRGLFKLVSSPNYLGEILEWIGWAILTWSLPGLAFAVFTIANLMPRAYKNHTWYRQQFSQYPQKRKALIPYIF